MKFSDVLDIRNGRNQRQVENENGKYPIYGSGGIMGRATDFICDAGTVVIGRKGSINNPIFVDEPFWNVDTAFGLVAHRDVLLPKYLFYFCVNFDFERLNTTVTIPSLTKANLLQIEINVPDMDEQRRVVSILDKICQLIDLQQQELHSLDQLVKSRFIELFGNYDLTHPQESWAPIKEVGTVVGGATPKTDHDEYWGGSYRWITPAELDADSGYIYDSVRKLTKAGVESCSLQEMPVGTVILSSRAPIGKVAIAGNTFYCNQGFKNIICREGITPRYLYTVLLLNVEYLNSLGRGATFKEISKGIVESIRIPVPSMEMQEQFAAFVEQTDKSKYYSSLSFRYCQAAANTYRQEWMTCRTSDF